MKKNNGILFSRVDKEDYWVSSSMAFYIGEDKVKDLSYKEMYELLKETLESDKIVDVVMEHNYLECDLFDEDDTYNFVRTYFDYGLHYEFENSEGAIVTFKFDQTDPTYIILPLIA